MAQFDQYADNYEEALSRGISVSGENKDFFAKQRIELLEKLLKALDFGANSILDYGCGTGSAITFLENILKANRILGVDISSESLEIAQTTTGNIASFCLIDEFVPSASFDLAFCNGVFHHIPLGDRDTATQKIFEALRPGGMFAFWENNPLNPGTRLVMSRIPFDNDAITLRAGQAKNLLKRAGFNIVRVDFAFIFPRPLSAFRRFEPVLAKFPFGAQYQVLAIKPPN